MNLLRWVNSFVNSDRDYPLLTGFMSGLYPMLFFYSGNYESINSIAHLCFFIGLFLVLPVVFFYAIYKTAACFQKTARYQRHLLFVLVIEVTATFLSQVHYLTLKKKLLLGLLIVLVVLSKKFQNQYKKVVIFLMLLCIFPAAKVIYTFVSKQVCNPDRWMAQSDEIRSIKFTKTPNVYFIEPDGYAGQDAMGEKPYAYNDTMFDYLKSKSFTIYSNTMSNYPASLASNASMFGMKHHYLGKILESPFEMENARDIICGNNPVVEVFKRNQYKTHFIVEDEYFQKNFSGGEYDFYNIHNSEIPYFSDDNSVKKDVYEDLKKCISARHKQSAPAFYFIEKLLPHHIALDGSGVENERVTYLRNLEKSNEFIRKTIDLIDQNDPNAIVLIVGDHGGWVGIENIGEMFATKDPILLRSIFSNLIAIRWNDPSHTKYDAHLQSNVNIFRILFAYLAQDTTLLQHLEKDDAYHIRQHSLSKKPEKVLERR
ncbi:sulfatase-like hydrolase/transferase [Flavobacterium sp.]|uniref:sulfatase-like hydrolase/transferase n=1 Tax=Flavobacterium sp. TaxID=239 RepID=UPI0026141239|nr:sulfatase-like hydrolase/transferase [Flavobacterium sp.]